jgi:hypothetical protein
MNDGKDQLIMDLPSLESLQGVDLDISPTEVRLILPGSNEEFRIALPQGSSRVGLPTAKFSKKRGQLTVVWDSVADQATQSQDVPSRVEAQEKRSAQELSAAGDKHEEIECSEFLEDEVEHALKQCAVTELKSIAPLNGASVLPSDFVFEGQAHIKESTCNFKASVSFKWEMLDTFGGFLGASGTGKIAEVTSEHESPTVAIDVRSSGSLQAKAAGDWMKQHGSRLISECLNGKNLSRKVFSAWDEAAWDTDSTSQCTVSEPKKLDQDSLNAWAKAWLKQKLESLVVRLFGGAACATFSALHVSGEVCISSKEDKSASEFKLEIDAAWSIATSSGKVEGTMSILDFTRAGSTIQVEAASGQKASGQLLTSFRKTGVAAVRETLQQFMNELQHRSGP